MISVRLNCLVSIGACLAMAACGSATPNSTGARSTGGGGNHVSESGGAINNGGTGGANFVVLATGGATQTVVDAGRPLRCDANGENCVCMNIAEIGTAGQFGSNPGKDGDVAFQTWMNDPANSNAHVDLYKTKPTLDSTFLANYDVVVLQSLSNDSNSGQYWTFSQEEVDALTQWVNDGGAIISLMGYSGNTTEVNSTNALLKFSGISYNTDDIIADADCKLLRDGNGQTMCYCATAIGVTDWKTEPDVVALSTHSADVSRFQVGAFHGRSINAPSDALIAATFTGADGKTHNVAVGKIVGKGRVFAWNDEWITYTSQWDGTGNTHTSEQWCDTYLPQQIFQTAQFWFNMIKWSLPDAQCFQIVGHGEQTVVIW